MDKTAGQPSHRLIAVGGIAGIGAYLVWLTLEKTRREMGRRRSRKTNQQNGWKVMILALGRSTLCRCLIGGVGRTSASVDGNLSVAAGAAG